MLASSLVHYTHLWSCSALLVRNCMVSFPLPLPTRTLLQIISNSSFLFREQGCNYRKLKILVISLLFSFFTGVGGSRLIRAPPWNKPQKTLAGNLSSSSNRGTQRTLSTTENMVAIYNCISIILFKAHTNKYDDTCKKCFYNHFDVFCNVRSSF